LLGRGTLTGGGGGCGLTLLDMRKAMPRDVLKKSVIPLDHPVTADEVGW
jgi:hypothetical protein